MALLYSLSPSALPPRLLCIAETDTFENWFSATLSNLVIIYICCFWRSILKRHWCHNKESEMVWLQWECCLTWMAHTRFCVWLPPRAIQWSGRVPFFTALFPPHFFAFHHRSDLQNNLVSHEALLKRPKHAYALRQVERAAVDTHHCMRVYSRCSM